MEIILRAHGVNGALPRASGQQESNTPQKTVRAENTFVLLEESRTRDLGFLASLKNSRDERMGREEPTATAGSAVSDTALQGGDSQSSWVALVWGWLSVKI